MSHDRRPGTGAPPVKVERVPVLVEVLGGGVVSVTGRVPVLVVDHDAGAIEMWEDGTCRPLVPGVEG